MNTLLDLYRRADHRPFIAKETRSGSVWKVLAVGPESTLIAHREGADSNRDLRYLSPYSEGYQLLAKYID